MASACPLFSRIDDDFYDENHFRAFTLPTILVVHLEQSALFIYICVSQNRV